MSAGMPGNLDQWRNTMRAELIARRQAVPEATRRDWDLAISLTLLHALPLAGATVIGFCWPYKAEYDARHLLRQLRPRGVRCALPEVRGRNEPLLFRYWEPGVPMKSGPLGIAYPDQTEVLDPQILLIPVVGFGRAGDRLGYGAGYFDRTLAAYARRPLSIGVGYELARLDTIFPQPYDVLLDAIVTEVAARRNVDGRLQEGSAAQLRAHLESLQAERARQARQGAHRLAGD